MEIVEIKHIEDCFDGSSIKEILFSEKINAAFIHALGKKGSLQYFKHFARPFFKIRIEGKVDAKGIEGNSTMRIHLKAPNIFTVDNLVNFLAQLDLKK